MDNSSELLARGQVTGCVWTVRHEHRNGTDTVAFTDEASAMKYATAIMRDTIADGKRDDGQRKYAEEFERALNRALANDEVYDMFNEFAEYHCANEFLDVDETSVYDLRTGLDHLEESAGT